jgi:hypothetical protein
MEAQPSEASSLTPKLVQESVLIVQDVLENGTPLDDEAWEHDARELLLRLGPLWDRRTA